jgi:hypothetical protein
MNCTTPVLMVVYEKALTPAVVLDRYNLYGPMDSLLKAEVE